MAYGSSTPRLGHRAINETNTIQYHVLGSRINAYDPVYGEGEFIYLEGCASTVVGSLVTWDGGATVPAYQTVLAAATANAGQQLAVAMSINLAANFGWYQISGTAIVATNGTLAGANVKVYLAGSGQVTGTATTGLGINGARALTATGTPAAGLAVIQIQDPQGEGYVS